MYVTISYILLTGADKLAAHVSGLRRGLLAFSELLLTANVLCLFNPYDGQCASCELCQGRTRRIRQRGVSSVNVQVLDIDLSLSCSADFSSSYNEVVWGMSVVRTHIVRPTRMYRCFGLCPLSHALLYTFLSDGSMLLCSMSASFKVLGLLGICSSYCYLLIHVLCLSPSSRVEGRGAKLRPGAGEGYMSAPLSVLGMFVEHQTAGK